MYYPSSENKGADQLRSYCEADLRLCFRLGRLLVFPCGGSNFICFDWDLSSHKSLPAPGAICVLFVLRIIVSDSQQFFSRVGMEPTLPGFNQYCRVYCSSTQHGAICGDRAHDLSIRCSTTMPPRSQGVYPAAICIVWGGGGKMGL